MTTPDLVPIIVNKKNSHCVLSYFDFEWELKIKEIKGNVRKLPYWQILVRNFNS